MDGPARTPSLCEERTRRTFEAGRRAHRRVDLDYERFAAYAARAVPRLENGDYYLAIACELGVPGAWEGLQARFGRPLRAMMRRRGASRHDVDQLLDDVWGRLASPPARGATRTRIGTYDGQGPLLAWLATVAWRRLVDAWRAGARDAPLGPDPGATSDDPAERLASSEMGLLVARVLEEAWKALTTRELEAVVLKYRRQLPQLEIARILRVSPPRVTRLLQSAARRLRAAVEARYELRAHAAMATSNQDALLEIVARLLSRTETEARLHLEHGEGRA